MKGREGKEGRRENVRLSARIGPILLSRLLLPFLVHCGLIVRWAASVMEVGLDVRMGMGMRMEMGESVPDVTFYYRAFAEDA